MIGLSISYSLSVSLASGIVIGMDTAHKVKEEQTAPGG